MFEWVKKLCGWTVVGETDSMGQTRLHRALAEKAFVDVKEISDLLAQGEDPNVRDGDGNTSLHIALTRSYLYAMPEIIFKLMDAGADPHIANKKESPFIFWQV